MSVDLEALFPLRRPVGDRPIRVRLLCLPFAGGTAGTFRDWPALLPSYVDVCAVELPGRGTRFDDPPIDRMDALVAHLDGACASLFDVPVAIFGHSLGARVAFSWARHQPRIGALIASGARGPHLSPRKIRADLPRAELVRELEELGGTPKEVLADGELLDLFLPMMRSDFRLSEHLVPEQAQIACPITTLAAHDDTEVSIAEARTWKERTSSSFRFVETDGGHFFVVSRRDAVLAEVSRVLATLASE